MTKLKSYHVLRYQVRFFVSVCMTLIMGFGFDAYAQEKMSKEDSLLQVLEEAKYDTSRVLACISIADFYQIDSPEKAASFAERAYNYSIQTKDSFELSEVFFQIARSYYGRRVMDSALYFADKALRRAKAEKKLSSEQDAQNLTAIIYYRQERYAEAVEGFINVLRLHEKKNDRVSAAVVSNNLSVILKDLGRNEEALIYANTAIEVFDSLKDDRLIGGGHNNLGLIYKGLKRYDEALHHFTSAVKFKEKSESGKNSLAGTYGNIADVANELKNYELSEEYYFKALKVFKKTNEMHRLHLTYLSIAENYIDAGKYAEARQYLNFCEVYLPKNTSLSFESSYFFELYQWYKAQKMFKKALESFEKYEDKSQENKSKINDEKIEKIHTEYKVDKKNEEIKLLSKEKNLLQKEKKLKEQEARQYLITFSVSGFFFLAFLVVGFIALRNRQQSVQELKLKNTEINQQKEELRAQNDNIEQQHSLLSIANKELRTQKEQVTSSIRYARQIQSGMLPGVDTLREAFSDAFVIYRPKALVSGDFYWFGESGGEKVFVLADATGHGVPGAFMAMIGHTLLNDIVKARKITSPVEILEALDKGLRHVLKQDKGENSDAMDVAVLSVSNTNTDTVSVRFSGAKRPLYLLRNEKTNILKGSRRSVGGTRRTQNHFEELAFDLEKGARLILFSDGFTDQFNENRQKFTSSKLRQLIREGIIAENMQELESFCVDALNEHQGGAEQIDDITLVGIEV